MVESPKKNATSHRGCAWCFRMHAMWWLFYVWVSEDLMVKGTYLVALSSPQCMVGPISVFMYRSQTLCCSDWLCMENSLQWSLVRLHVAWFSMVLHAAVCEIQNLLWCTFTDPMHFSLAINICKSCSTTRNFRLIPLNISMPSAPRINFYSFKLFLNFFDFGRCRAKIQYRFKSTRMNPYRQNFDIRNLTQVIKYNVSPLRFIVQNIESPKIVSRMPADCVLAFEIDDFDFKLRSSEFLKLNLQVNTGCRKFPWIWKTWGLHYGSCQWCGNLVVSNGGYGALWRLKNLHFSYACDCQPLCRLF